MRPDGSHPRQITHPGTRYGDSNPIYAPGGQRLVFFRFDEKRDKDAIFTIHADGTQYATNHAVEVGLCPGCRLVSERTLDPRLLH